MKLNHLDLQVPDVQLTAAFLETYLGFEMLSSRQSPAIAIMNDRHGFVLVLQRRKPEEQLPEGFHIGCYVDSVAEVQAFWQRTTDAGLAPTPVQTNGRGTLTYLRAPGDFAIEVVCSTRY